jgi:hypothetical protein
MHDIRQGVVSGEFYKQIKKLFFLERHFMHKKFLVHAVLLAFLLTFLKGLTFNRTASALEYL